MAEEVKKLATRARTKTRKSWAEDIHMTDDITNIKVKLLAKGGIAVGKTTLMGSGPKPFILDAETGLLTLLRSHIPSYQLGRKAKGHYYDRTMAILDSIERDEDVGTVNFAEIETVCLDSVSKLNELLLQDIMSKKPTLTKPGYDEWGELNMQIVAIMNRLLQLDKHVIVSVGEATKVNENGSKFHTLNMRGSYKDFLEHEFDFVLWMNKEVSARGKTSYFTTGTTMQGRSGKMRGITLPEKMDNVTFPMIFAEIEKELAKVNGAKVPVEEIVEETSIM